MFEEVLHIHVESERVVKEFLTSWDLTSFSFTLNVHNQQQLLSEKLSPKGTFLSSVSDLTTPSKGRVQW